MTISTLPIRIYYEDTDAVGIVYYANYLKFFERGRTELFREIKIEQDILLEKHIAFVIKKVELDCIKPARFNQLIFVKTQILSHKNASIIFQQEIIQEDKTLLCRSTTQVACVNLKTTKPTAMPAEIIEVI